MAVTTQELLLKSLATKATTDDTDITTAATNSDRAAGQVGNIFITGTTAATCAVSGKVFVSIQVITDCVFNSSAGGLTPETAQLFMGDTSTSTDIDANAGAAIDGITFPAGTVLFGRWTSITLVSGSIVAYIG